ncbi:MAG: hypothetical protein HY721_03590 [Planctomycetes bacterium]|nr:hypothetical protein [Planctomycetota bacterium]
MDAAHSPAPPAPQHPQRQGKGCFFWGCMSLCIAIGAFGGCVALGSLWIYWQVRDFTSDEPAEIPVREPGPGEYQALEGRMQAFEKAAEADAELEVSADDLNLLLAGDRDLKRFARHAHVRIEGDQVLLEVSIPLDEVAPPAKKVLPGRYFNGTVGVKLGLEAGRLTGRVEQASVKGKPLPARLLDAVRKEDVFRDARLPRRLESFLERAKSLEVREGKVVLRR